MKLNLGAGDFPFDGYENLDRKSGSEIYPLKYADGTIDEIRASHVLEHFSHRLTGTVLHEWARVLKPGGLLKIAVPNFDNIVERYIAGENLPFQGFIMGGHIDDDDHHGAVFSPEALHEALAAAGLVGIERWTSEVKDCAALPISLNLQAYKPPEKWPRVAAVMSTPRLGFMDNYFCGYTLPQMGIQLRKHTGAFWGQCLTRAIEESLPSDPEYILTLDYDTIFTKQDVQAMLLLMMQHPEIDALAPLQASRTKDTPLLTINQDGEKINKVPRGTFDGPMTRLATAHFGLTLLRTEKVKSLQRPWIIETPAEDGGWGDGRTDGDIHFWRQWEAAGNSLYLANRVPVGHAELMIRWPDENMQATYQHPSDFWNTGKPMEVWK